jgi:ABC-2 type transport system ATP-binding protein
MIHVENLTKYYKDLCAVDQITFDIPKGEILGLLGPNGAGKTTTLRMLTGFLRPSSGNVRVKDFDIEAHPVEIKNLIGYLPESAPLYHDMIVYDYLNYVAAIRAIAPQEKLGRIKYLADLCGLNEVMHQPIAELSKGYKQRVGLAHAMMSDPEILILDEPTSGLDPNQIVEIRKIIRRVGQEKTIILSTHILSEAEAACDRVVIINRGKIVADGDAESLKQSDGQDNLIRIVLQDADQNQVRSLVETIAGVTQTEIRTDGAGLVNADLKCQAANDIRATVYHAIKQTDWTLLEFYQETQSLENIFRNLTREN